MLLLPLPLETLKHCNAGIREELDKLLPEKSFVESSVSVYRITQRERANMTKFCFFNSPSAEVEITSEHRRFEMLQICSL